MNRAGIVGACWVESRCHIQSGDGSIILCFGFGRRDVTDGFEQSSVVEPIHPFKRGEFDGFEGSPRPATMNDLGFVKTIDRFCQSVIVTVANTADRGLDSSLGEALLLLP